MAVDARQHVVGDDAPPAGQPFEAAYGRRFGDVKDAEGDQARRRRPGAVGQKSHGTQKTDGLVHDDASGVFAPDPCGPLGGPYPDKKNGRQFGGRHPISFCFVESVVDNQSGGYKNEKILSGLHIRFVGEEEGKSGDEAKTGQTTLDMIQLTAQQSTDH